MSALVDGHTVAKAIRLFASIPNVSFDADGLVDDLRALIEVWPEERSFLVAISSTVRAIGLIAEGKALASSLNRELAGWQSFHYPHSRNHHGKADMRLVYRRVESGVQVLGFGHRHVPSDVYARMGDRKR